MKIVIFLHSLAGGGAERIAATLAGAWSEQGHRVAVLTLAGTAEDRYALHSQVRRVALNLVSDSGSVREAMASNWRRLSALRSALVDLEPDLTIAFMATSNVQLALLRGWIPGRLVGSERVHPPQHRIGRTWEWLRRWTYGRLDAVVVLAEESADWVRRHTRARIVVRIPNPVRLPLPSQQPIVDPAGVLEPRRRLLLMVGRLADQKQPEHALLSMARLAASHPDWDLVIIGEGPLRTRLESLRQTMGLEARVKLPGHAGNIGDWYRRADLFLMTSAYEGFPNSLAEALSHGVAAVSYDCDTGPRDLITDGVDGLLVPVGDLDALTVALDRLMGDDESRRRLATAAAEVGHRLALAQILAQWDRLFADLGLGARRCG